jgi:hypothetical protein
MRLKFIVALVLCLAAISLVSAQPRLVPLPSNTTPAHYLVFEADASGVVNVVHYQRVNMAEPFVSLDDTTLRSAFVQTRLDDTVSVQLYNANGGLAYQNVVTTSRWIRGEFLIDETDPNVMENGSNIDGHTLEATTRHFAVRVPDVGAGSSLALQTGFGIRSTVSFDIDSLSQTFAGREVAQREVTPVEGWDNGDPSNRVDVLILGDGYTAAEEAKFTNDAKTLADGFGAISPYTEYANYVNINQMFAASQQSGADRPACSDPDGDGLDDNTFVNTVYDATFCAYNIWRLLVTDMSKVYAAAAADPNWDQIIVIVNTSLYGGSGGPYSTLSTNQFAIDILQHEFGHSFTKLADEYSDAYPGFPTCSDTDVDTYNDCEANVTNTTVREQIKWNYWIDPSTSIPTSGPLADVKAAGLWEGARYLPTGMYRQGYDCMMRSLARPFCDVDSEAYVVKMYEGGWDQVNDFIRMVEPGTLSPAGTTVNISQNGSQTFSGQILSPEVGPEATVLWVLNGATVETDTAATGTTAEYTFTPALAGTYTLEMRVLDNSPIIHPTKRDGLATVNSWTITVEVTPTPTQTPTEEPLLNLVENGSFDMMDATQTVVLTPWTVKNGTGDKIKCDKDTDNDGEPDKFVARSGSCAFQFKGSAGENSKLSQSLDTSLLNLAIGDTLDLSLFVDGTSTANGKIKVRVKFSDDTPTGKITENFATTGDYTEVTGSYTLESDAVSSIKVQIGNRGVSGKVFVDDVTLTQSTAMGLLPLR